MSPSPQQTVVINQAPNTSGLAIAGLIFSILGWFTCGLLCIPGAFLCFLALFSRGPKGTAIAGLIVGFPGTLFFAFVGLGVIMSALGLGTAVSSAVDDARRANAEAQSDAPPQPPVAHNSNNGTTASAESVTPATAEPESQAPTQTPDSSVINTEFHLVGYYKVDKMRGLTFFVTNPNRDDIEAFCQEKKATLPGGRLLKIHFFDDRANTPDVTLKYDFPESSNAYLVADYYSNPFNGTQDLKLHKDIPEQPSTQRNVGNDRPPTADSRPKRESRTWTDATEQFSIEAVFVSCTNGQVKIKRDDTEEVITIPLDKLSESCKQYIELLRK